MRDARSRKRKDRKALSISMKKSILATTRLSCPARLRCVYEFYARPIDAAHPRVFIHRAALPRFTELLQELPFFSPAGDLYKGILFRSRALLPCPDPRNLPTQLLACTY